MLKYKRQAGMRVLFQSTWYFSPLWAFITTPEPKGRPNGKIRFHKLLLITVSRRNFPCQDLLAMTDFRCLIFTSEASQVAQQSKASTCQCRRCQRCGFTPWLRRIPGKGNDNPLQYSCLGNLIGTGAWCAIVHGVAKSQTQRSTHTVFI